MPPFDTTLPVTAPPDEMVSKPPEETCVAVAWPPAKTRLTPPALTKCADGAAVRLDVLRGERSERRAAGDGARRDVVEAGRDRDARHDGADHTQGAARQTIPVAEPPELTVMLP